MCNRSGAATLPPSAVVPRRSVIVESPSRPIPRPWRARVRTPARLVLTFAAAGTVLAGGAAVAAPPGTDTVITGCYDRTQGSLRIVDAGTTCRQTENRITWNEQGPAGPAGPQGVAGPAGEAGAQGATGPAGPAGPADRQDRSDRRDRPARESPPSTNSTDSPAASATHWRASSR